MTSTLTNAAISMLLQLLVRILLVVSLLSWQKYEVKT